ncbi:tetratricopeptide repeat protein [Streptomyces sp. NPDC054833]
MNGPADLHVFQDRGPVYRLTGHQPQQGKEDTAWLLAQPSRLLAARSRVVDFTGRDQEQADLETWRDAAGPRMAARWLHAPGGQGKTRLAAEFATRSAAEGWKVVTVVHGKGTSTPPPQSVDLRLDSAAGVLLVVDYADRWPLTHLNWLFSNTLLHHRIPTRLLLLARSAHPWAPVESALEELHVATDQYTLQPVPVGDAAGERERMFAVARDCFAARYGLPDPSRIGPPGPLHHADFGLILALHMAALAAVDAYVHGDRPPADMAGLSAYLLKRERRHWQLLYENDVEGLDYKTPPHVMRRAVFAAALTGATPHHQGTAILRSLGLETHPDRVLHDHAVCYPPSEANKVLEPLLPDRLAEDFLALALPGHDVQDHSPTPWASEVIEVLITRELDGSAPTHTARAITFLAAAAERWDHIGPLHLYPLLHRDPQLALDAGSAALTALANLKDVDPALLEAIEARFSSRRTDLDLGIAALTHRLTPHRIAATGDLAEQARLYGVLALRQWYAGNHNQAVEAEGQAVELLRQLAQADRDAHEPGLANRLSNLSRGLSTVGQHKAALRAAAEAVAVRRRRVLTRRGLWRLRKIKMVDWAGAAAAPLADLAISLTRLGDCLRKVGRYEEAQRAVEEALEIHRRLAPLSLLNVDLAESMSDLAAALTAMGSSQEAFEATEQAVRIYRRFVPTDPVVYEPKLAEALSCLALALSNAGRRQEAPTAIEQAVEIYQRLAQARPAVYEPKLAEALTNLSATLIAAGRQQEAPTAAEQAVEINRRLTETNRPVYEPDFAKSLTRLAFALSKAGRRQETLTALEQAVEIYQRLKETNRPVYEPELAEALISRAAHMDEAGRLDGRLEAAEQAVSVCRRLAQADLTAHEPRLVRSLNNLAIFLTKAGQLEEAVTASQQTVEIYRRLAQTDPVTHGPDLAISLNQLGIRLAKTDRWENALAATEESVKTWRKLSAPGGWRHRTRTRTNLAAYEADIAHSSTNLGICMFYVGFREGAVDVTQQAGAELLARAAEDATLDHSHRVWGAKALSGMRGHEQAGADLLLRLAEDTALDGLQRVRAAAALAEVEGHEQAGADLLGHFAEDTALDGFPRVGAAGALTFMEGHERAGVDLLLRFAEDSALDDDLRVRAAEALADLCIARPPAGDGNGR